MGGILIVIKDAIFKVDTVKKDSILSAIKKIFALLVFCLLSVSCVSTEHSTPSIPSVDHSIELIAEDSILEARNEYGETPLMFAAHIGDSEIVNDLLVAGADVNIKDNTGWTALQLAAKDNHMEVCMAC